METTAFIDKYFGQATQIYEICDTLSLPPSDARLYSYIHVKMEDETPPALGSDSTEAEALKVMLGYPESDGISRELKKLKPLQETRNDLYATDHAIRENTGMESRLTSELRNRLRFHTDPVFMKSKLRYYLKVIRPRLEKERQEKDV